VQRDSFMAGLINDRDRPCLTLVAPITVIDGEMMGGGGYQANGLCAASLTELCRMLMAARVSATYLQIFDCLPGASRTPAVFCRIAEAAAWQEPEFPTHLSGRKKKERPWHAV
jgi:hypothetical protein